MPVHPTHDKKLKKFQYNICLINWINKLQFHWFSLTRTRNIFREVPSFNQITFLQLHVTRNLKHNKTYNHCILPFAIDLYMFTQYVVVIHVV